MTISLSVCLSVCLNIGENRHMIDRIGWSLGYLHAEARLDRNMYTFSKILEKLFLSIPACFCRLVTLCQCLRFVLRFWRYINLYVCMYVCVYVCIL